MRVLRFLPLAVMVALGVAPSAEAANGGGGRGGGHGDRDPIRVVASGLDSPRHLAFGDRGDLFVAESGRGGAGPCFTGAEGASCVGDSGAVTKIDRWGRQSRSATGLASMAAKGSGAGAIGPHGITVLGSDTVIITNGGPTEPLDADGKPISRDTLAAANPIAGLFGKVLLLGPRGRPIPLGDIWAFERDVNPDRDIANPAVDSNPVDVLHDGHRLVVADAGGNSIDTVDYGRVRNLAVFANRLFGNPFGGPDVPTQSVPTAVVEGPDHQYYVSELTGFPFPVGGARVLRVNPRSGETKPVLDGFTNIMDLAFGRDGTLYVLEIDHDSLLGPGEEGAIYAVTRWGKRLLKLPAGTLPTPGGITVGNDGLYVTTNATSPGGGQVVRIRDR